jgi:hypothetical protein
MAILKTYFKDFLTDIRLTQSQREACAKGHAELRDGLKDDPDLSPIIIGTFLQGSYKRHTAIRSPREESRSDVDVIVVTNMDSEKWTPRQALDRFKPFLEKHYKGKYQAQGRSWGIKLDDVDIDLVVTSAPGEATRDAYLKFYDLDEEELRDAADQEWKAEPLLIPDRNAGKWKKTHPLAQILATLQKNKATNRHYINVVKAIKWWKHALHPEPEPPKSYPLEHLIWHVCPDAIQSVAEGVVLAFEHIRDDYRHCVASGTKPFLPDHGVPEHDVFAKVRNEEFAAFHKLASVAATTAREAYDEEDKAKSARKWRELFGEKFPLPPSDSSNKHDGSKDGGYTPRQAPSIIGGGRFA